MVYRETLKSEVKNPAFWEIFDYKPNGELYYKTTGLRVVDLVKKFGDPYDSPVQITDVTQ